MAVVGNAHIIVQAITTGFKKDVEKALKDLNSTMNESGEKSAEEFNKGFDKKFKEYLKDFDPFEGKDEIFADGGKDAGKSFSSEFKTNLSMIKTIELMGNDFEKAGKEAGKRFSDGFNKQFKKSIQKQVPQALMPIGRGRSAARSFGGGGSLTKLQQEALRANEILSQLITTSYFVGPAISVAVGGISSLINGLVPLISQLSTALPALIVFPASLAAIGQAALVAKLAFKDFGGAVEAIAASRQGPGKKDPLAGLSDSALDLATGVVNAKEALADLGKSAGKGLFAPLAQSLGRITRELLPELAPAFQRTGVALGNMANQFSKAVVNASNLKELKNILGTNADVLSMFGSTLANLYDSLLSLGDAARPLILRFAKWTSTLTDGWKRSLELKNSTGSLTKTFNKAGDTAAQLGRIFGNLGRAIMTIGRSASGPGSGGELLLNLFEKSTKKFEKFTESVSKSGKLKQFFLDVAVNVNEISKLLVVVVKEFLKLGDDKAIGETAKALVPMVKSLGEMAKVLQSAAPSLGEFATKLADLLMKLTESESIKVFFSILNTALDTLNTVFGNETVRKIFGFVAALKAVILAIKLLKNVSVFFGKAIFLGYFAKASAAANTFQASMVRTQTVAFATSTAFKKLGLVISTAGASMVRAGGLARTFGAGMGASLTTMLVSLKGRFSQVPSILRAYSADLRQAGTSVGTEAGKAIGAAVTSAMSGVVLGTSSDTTGKAIGLAGILTSALAVGAISAPLGVAVGAIGLVTAAFAASGKEAKLAAEKVAGYAEAVYDASVAGESIIDPLTVKIMEIFKTQSEDVAQVLKDMGFYVEDFAVAIEGGAGAIEDYSINLVDNGLQKFGIDIQQYGIKNIEDLYFLLSRDLENTTLVSFTNALEDAGIDIEDFKKAVKFMGLESEGALDGVQRAALDASVANKDLADSGKLVGDRFFKSSADADLFASKLKDINDEAKNANKLERALSRIKENITEIKDSAEVAKQALIGLLNPPDTYEEVLSQAVLDLAGLGEELSEAEGNLKPFEITLALGKVEEQITDAITGAFEGGTFKSAADVTKFFGDLRASIDLFDISEADRNKLREKIDAALNDPEIMKKLELFGIQQGRLLGEGRAIAEIESYKLTMDQWASKNAGLMNKLLSGEALTKQEELDLRSSPTANQVVRAELRLETSLIKQETATAIAELEKEFADAFTVQIKPELASATGPTGWGASGRSTIKAELDGQEVFVKPKIANTNTWKPNASALLKANMVDVGIQGDFGLGAGILNKNSASVGAMRKLVANVKAEAAGASGFNLGSPSKVFRSFGRNVSEGLALGISDMSGAAVSAAKALASEVSGAGQFDLPTPGFGLPSSPGMSVAGLTSGVGAASQNSTTQNFNIQVESPRPMRTAKDVVREFQAASYRMGY